MNEDEIKSEESAEPADLNERYAELSRQAGLMRVGLLVLGATFATFLGVQNWRLSNDLQIVRGQMGQIAEAAKKDDQTIRVLAAKLFEYGQTHPDFAQQVLAKYGIGPAATPAAPGAPGTPGAPRPAGQPLPGAGTPPPVAPRK